MHLPERDKNSISIPSVRVVNGPSKTMGLAKFWTNLMALTVSFLSILQIQFFNKAALQSLILLQGQVSLKVLIRWFYFISDV